MEKLIKLFKEYVDNNGSDTKDIEKEYGVIDDGQGFLYGTREYLYEIIVSKKFGFIEWLVENDKIDLWSNRFTEKEEHYFGEQPDFTFQSVKYTHLLMLLSISSSPIDDLISYLK